MKVKIGNQIFDSNFEPIMLVLDFQDKVNIKDMLPEATKYCSFPSEYSTEVIKEFMKIDDLFYPQYIELNQYKEAIIYYKGELNEEQAINLALKHYPFLEGIISLNFPDSDSKGKVKVI